MLTSSQLFEEASEPKYGFHTALGSVDPKGSDSREIKRKVRELGADIVGIFMLNHNRLFNSGNLQIFPALPSFDTFANSLLRTIRYNILACHPTISFLACHE